MTTSSTENPDDRIEPLDAIPLAGDAINADTLPAGIEHRQDLGVAHATELTARRIHAAPPPEDFEECPRAVVTPSGDYLVVFPAGEGHYHSATEKVNEIVAYRSEDAGQSWEGPTTMWDVPYNQHAFIPLIPADTDRLYAFGTEPTFEEYTVDDPSAVENAPIAFRYSDDDGHTWSDPTFIRPENGPDFVGMSAMDMCETDDGTWLLGSHRGDWTGDPVATRQYVLRSEDQGDTWTAIPGPDWDDGWYVSEFDRMDEGRPIALGGGHVLLLVRTPEGHLWELRSDDDGRTWSDPEPTSLVHPDAPPAVEHLGDGRLVALHHNRHEGGHFSRTDRGELWLSLSDDDGRTWSEPRYLCSNAAEAYERFGSPQYRVSYADLLVDGDALHLFVDHQTRQVLQFAFDVDDLDALPTVSEFRSG